MSDFVTGGHLRLILQIALNVRLAGVLMVFVLTPQGLGPLVAGAGLSCLAVSFLTMRHIAAYEPRLAHSWWFPLLDAALTVALVVSTDPGGPAIAYVAGTAFVWSLVGRPWAVALAVLPVLAMLGLRLGMLLSEDDVDRYWATLVQVALLWLTILAGRRVRNLQEKHVRLQLDARGASIRSAQAEERVRLSVEMHDSVAKSLHGIHLMAEHLERRLAAERHELAPHVALLRESVARARTEARSLVQGYREPHPQESFVEQLRALVDGWAQTHPAFTVTTQLAPMAPGPGAAPEWLAAAGEALENVARHSGGDRVMVSSSEEDGWGRVTVVDNGAGMSRQDLPALVGAGHFGLDGMCRRMSRVGGRLELSPAPGGGVVVTLRGPADLGPGARTDVARDAAGGTTPSSTSAQGALP